MLFILSPAKKLDYDSTLPAIEATQPQFIERAKVLIEVLKNKSQDELAKLMKISDVLAELNYTRYHEWVPVFNEDNSRAAVFAFNGDVYDGLEAQNLNKTQLQWAQSHLGILSGLYGYLRPLDLMQPYRLEMGTRLVTAQGKNLYEYWGDTITDYINQHLVHHKNPVLINLASEEYFKSINSKILKAPIVQCVFQEKRDGKYKIISFNAKKARGLIARYAIENQVDTIEQLQQFNWDGYQFDAEASDEKQLFFRRERQK